MKESNKSNIPNLLDLCLRWLFLVENIEHMKWKTETQTDKQTLLSSQDSGQSPESSEFEFSSASKKVEILPCFTELTSGTSTLLDLFLLWYKWYKAVRLRFDG